MSAKVTAKAVSQISEQLPSFIGEEYPLYDKFVKNYFEFLETIVVPYGMKISDDFSTEAGILTIDSSSGSGPGDQRLGSTGYLMGFSYGF